MDFREQRVWDIVNGKNKVILNRVDEVVYPAPWIVDEKFLNDH
jgi:hypothetical protein